MPTTFFDLMAKNVGIADTRLETVSLGIQQFIDRLTMSGKSAAVRQHLPAETALEGFETPADCIWEQSSELC
jgi:hypothetical protein